MGGPDAITKAGKQVQRDWGRTATAVYPGRMRSNDLRRLRMLRKHMVRDSYGILL